MSRDYRFPIINKKEKSAAVQPEAPAADSSHIVLNLTDVVGTVDALDPSAKKPKRASRASATPAESTQ